MRAPLRFCIAEDCSAFFREERPEDYCPEHRGARVVLRWTADGETRYVLLEGAPAAIAERRA